MSRPRVYKRFVTMAVLLSLCSPLFITNTRARAASQPLSNLSTSKISPDLQRLILSGNGDTRVKAIVQKIPSSSGGLLGGLIGGLLSTGIDSTHKSFATNGKIKFSKDFTGENRTDDPWGHGTHVAAIAAGNGAPTSGAYEGIAPAANLVNLRVLNSQGFGTVSGVLAALDWLVANKNSYNVRVVNMSLGTPAISSYENDPLCNAVRKLVDSGVVVVAAAGNNGKNANGQKIYGAIHCPGNEPS